ncbi:type ISP restriction/modification enzyme [Daejeonella sp.]|uniref:type ISP restriction/modification enzyme n=1 Tax=Daejeonella sp. TaxID=2805397 RepID=UPI002C255E37|nr:type ISP restriction/modification enzyme [Daejeonella sp.]HQT23987.1 N-6 DNA methylase [Daejeonella sp.]HQT58651.1 N-6 DNA methylase [Daejeonella sp.]
MLTRKDVPVGYIEAKDIGVDLHAKILKEQFDRYKAGLPNLILTDYLEFHFYKSTVFSTSIAIARIENGNIVPLENNFAAFEGLIKNFAQTVSQTIKSPTKLAEMMAGKAKLMAHIIENSLNFDDENDTRSSLKKQMLSFKQMLIHDIDNKAFSDIYAQTIAYGMFAARYHDPTLPTFSRQEAATLIPKSNPFLRKLFQDIAGYDLDDRLVWIVDELVNIFLATDVADIMRNFGKSTKQEDPVVHFYETFLAAYNPALRKARGVWYTPQPVVNFIVRAVDDILKTEFNLPQGLADTTKIKATSKHVTKSTTDQRSKLKEVLLEQEVHKVQILDPATGTGTFLAEVVRHIYKNFEGQQGIWSNYVNQHLIPRLNGFELLMASYAMAHLKMDMLLTETGYKATTDQRFRIFLTNSLEEAHPDTGTLFSSWLSDEADQANAVKRDTPVMCVIGNPPYSVSSSNKNIWIQNLIEIYKANLNERKINIDDDYIKFIRYGQHFIDKNGSGVLAYISNNSFIDGVTHRQMRHSLLSSFDKLYILDLHGNSKKKEVCSDGSADQNVFDIMQGVSINIFIKTDQKKKSELGKVFSYDLQGKREMKYKVLLENSIRSIKWKQLQYKEPYYFFVPKNFDEEENYNMGFKVNELLLNNNTGIQTKCDELSIQFEQSKLREVVDNFKSLDLDVLKKKYPNKTDSSGWNFKDAVNDLKQNKIHYTKILYRPFDIRFTLYTGKSSGFIGRPRTTTMSHMVNGNNLGLITLRINGELSEYVCLITDHIVEKGSLPKGNYSLFPLYLYTPTDGQQTIDETAERTPNLNISIVKQIAEKMAIQFTKEKETFKDTFAPIDILDYIYSVLHSPSYREKYKEFLKIDFPRVPYPENKDIFWKLVEIGSKLRQIHLLKSPEVNKYITQYPIDGDNIVTKIKFEENYEIINGDTITHIEPVYPMGRVYINDTQYFQMVPEVAWNFYIGGYQPAQKWLKDRKGRELSFEDILHYQKIIVALKRTDELMKEIDKVFTIA